MGESVCGGCGIAPHRQTRKSVGASGRNRTDTPLRTGFESGVCQFHATEARRRASPLGEHGLCAVVGSGESSPVTLAYRSHSHRTQDLHAPMPPITQTLLLISIAAFASTASSGLVRPPCPRCGRWGHGFLPDGDHPCVPARRSRSPVLQHAGTVDVGKPNGLGRSDSSTSTPPRYSLTLVLITTLLGSTFPTVGASACRAALAFGMMFRTAPSCRCSSDR